MKLLLFLFLSFSIHTFSQTTIKATANTGFEIIGNITGFADGTTVSLLNGQTGAVENETIIKQNNFFIKGSVTSPEFKVIMFNKQQPYVIVFLDNSHVVINGKKEALNKVQISGSPTHKDFTAFNNAIQPYNKIFEQNATYDSVASHKAAIVCYNFASKNFTSFIAPLAVFRYYQSANDITKTENLFNKLSPNVKKSTMGNNVEKFITETKSNGADGILADFTQTDTAGIPVKLSSFKGKYVLVDFWASWCRPCRMENPNVVNAFKRFKNKNFTVLGVSLDQTKSAWIDAIAMDGLTWTHVSDLKGWSNEVAQQNKIYNIPQNILIDPQGKIIAKNLRGDALEMKLTQIFH